MARKKGPRRCAGEKNEKATYVKVHGVARRDEAVRRRRARGLGRARRRLVRRVADVGQNGRHDGGCLNAVNILRLSVDDYLSAEDCFSEREITIIFPPQLFFDLFISARA